MPTNSDKQNLLYFAIILVFLIISFFGRRELKISQILKYLAWWSVIIFICVALYAYRFEFSDFKSRIFGALNPQHARLENRKIMIEISQDGHFYVDLSLNNVPVKFMIDTGASDIVIDLENAKKIGIKTSDLNFSKRYQTANGTVFGAEVVLNEISIAGVKFYNIKASVNGAELGTPLLGMSFLRQFKKYEFYQDRLVLTL